MTTQQNTITIYGPGCARCEELELRARQAVNALSGQYTIRHERDAAAMAAAGILSTPALELNGIVLVSGRVPSLQELQRLLAEAAGKPAGCTCQTTEPACGCSCKCAAKGAGGKRFMLWAAAAVLAIGGIKYINHSQRAEVPAAATAAAADVRAVYYTFGKRCTTCLRMETWAREAVEQNFAQELGQGVLRFETQEADADTVRQHGLTTKSLLLHRSGAAPRTVNLTRIWELSRDETAFKDYVAGEIRAVLNAHE